MQNILSDLSDEPLVKKMIKTNWENYHYCLGRSPNVELSIGRYLTWFITNMPDHFMNLVVCTDLPSRGAEELIENALNHFRTLSIGKVTWLAEEGVPALEIKNYLIMHGLTYAESYSTDMAVDLSCLPEKLPVPTGLEIIPVEDEKTLQLWIHTASIGFGVPEEYERIWYDFFVEAVFD